MQEFVGLVLSASPVDEADLAKATAEDPLLSSIVCRATSGCWTNHASAEEPYFLVRHYLTVRGGILMMHNRFIIPAALQMAVLRLAHEDHPGPQVFLDSLWHSVWWPHLTKDATDLHLIVTSVGAVVPITLKNCSLPQLSFPVSCNKRPFSTFQ